MSDVAEHWGLRGEQANKVPAGVELTFHWGRHCGRDIRLDDSWKGKETGLLLRGWEEVGVAREPARDVSLGPAGSAEG